MPLPILAAAAIAQAVGSAANAWSQSRQSAADRRERTRQFDASHQLNKDSLAATLSRQLGLNPMRDQAAFMLRNRMGQPSQRFQFGQSDGGIDQTALNQQNAGYTQGAGGLDPRVMQTILARLGPPR